MEMSCWRLAKEVGYVGAGTVEPLYNPDRTYCFLELNRHLLNQVELSCLSEHTSGDRIGSDLGEEDLCLQHATSATSTEAYRACATNRKAAPNWALWWSENLSSNPTDRATFRCL